MKTAILSFSAQGAILSRKLSALLGDACKAYAPAHYAEDGVCPVEGSLSDWTSDAMHSFEALVFIGATGIAVRLIAPHIESKTEDPAVLVVDEKSQFVISLLSGHIGGANALAAKVAKLLGAQPVITTATDVHNVFAVDVWAQRNRLVILNPENIKEISGALLRGETVGFVTEFPVEGDLPQGMKRNAAATNGVDVSVSVNRPFEKTLHLVPTVLSVGVGCRKGTSMDDIECAVLEVLEQNDLSIHAVETIASVDLKKEEQGLIAFAEKYNKRFVTYSANDLAKLQGDFTSSTFVKRITGADNICERASYKAAQEGRLLVKKQTIQKVTVAISMRSWGVGFEN